jgi:hypothetical protein
VDLLNYSKLYVLYRINTTVLNNEYIGEKNDCPCVKIGNKLKLDASIIDTAMETQQMLRRRAWHSHFGIIAIAL